MKKFRKTLSLILAVVMIISAVPLQSLALFDILFLKVEKVEITSDIPLSYKEISNYLDGDYTGIQMFDGSYEYTYKIYFTNGLVVDGTADSIDEPALRDYGIDSVYTHAYIAPSECKKAIEEGKSTVNVYFDICVTGKRGYNRYLEAKSELKIVNEIVKSVSLVGGMPESYDEDNIYDQLLGREIEIEYGDGRTETQVINIKDGYYCLGDESIGLYYGAGTYRDEVTGENVYLYGLHIYYVDSHSVIADKAIPCPYKKVEIIDSKFDGKGLLTSVTYKLTYENGDTFEKTCILEKGFDTWDYGVIDTVDGNDVYVGFDIYDYDYLASIHVGYTVWNINGYFVGDAEDCCDCRCHEDTVLSVMIMTFFCTIWEVIGINEECQCGKYHW